MAPVHGECAACLYTGSATSCPRLTPTPGRAAQAELVQAQGCNRAAGCSPAPCCLSSPCAHTAQPLPAGQKWLSAGVRSHGFGSLEHRLRQVCNPLAGLTPAHRHAWCMLCTTLGAAWPGLAETSCSGGWMGGQAGAAQLRGQMLCRCVRAFTASRLALGAGRHLTQGLAAGRAQRHPARAGSALAPHVGDRPRAPVAQLALVLGHAHASDLGQRGAGCLRLQAPMAVTTWTWHPGLSMCCCPSCLKACCCAT